MYELIQVAANRKSVCGVIKLLSGLAEGKLKPVTDGGICIEIEYYFNEAEIHNRWHHALKYLMSEWSMYSGSFTYPVPHPTLSPYDSYYTANADGALFDATTEYGQNRLALCKWLAEQLTELIK